MTTRFLKLSNTIINTSKIIRITVEPDLYRIRFENHLQKINGFHIGFIGWIDSNDDYHEVYKDTDSKDYEIVKKWIETLE